MSFSSKPAYDALVPEIPHFQTLIVEKWGLLRLLSPPELAAACSSLETLAAASEKSPKEVIALVETLWTWTRGVGIGSAAFLGYRRQDPDREEGGKPMVLQLDGDIEALWQPWLDYQTTTFLDFLSILKDQAQKRTNLLFVCKDGSRSLSALLYLKDFLAGPGGLDTKQTPTLLYLEGGLRALKEFME